MKLYKNFCVKNLVVNKIFEIQIENAPSVFEISTTFCMTNIRWKLLASFHAVTLPRLFVILYFAYNPFHPTIAELSNTLWFDPRLNFGFVNQLWKLLLQKTSIPIYKKLFFHSNQNLIKLFFHLLIKLV